MGREDGRRERRKKNSKRDDKKNYSINMLFVPLRRFHSKEYYQARERCSTFSVMAAVCL
jgi:hypothetical protein